MDQPIPPPTGNILSLLTSLSNASNHAKHSEALSIRDNILSSSPESYGQACIQFGRILSCPSPDHIPPSEIEIWSKSDGGISVFQLRHDPIGGWNQLREMAGLMLKNSLVKPPKNVNSPGSPIRLLPSDAEEIKVILLKGITDINPHVRRVSSSIISSATVTNDVMDGMEPLPLSTWGESQLTPFLIHCLENAIQQYHLLKEAQNNNQNAAVMDEHVHCALLGSLQTLRKMLEDGASKFERGSGAAFSRIVPCLLQLLTLSSEEQVKKDALHCCVFMIPSMPSSLVSSMSDLLAVLSNLGTDDSAEIRKLVCRAIVFLLQYKSEYIQAFILPISQFILKATSDPNPSVSLEACEFWLTFGTLDAEACTEEMSNTLRSLLPQLVPTLLQSMVYPTEKREELLEQNEFDEQEDEDKDIQPVFHRSKSKGGGVKNEGGRHSGDDDDASFDSDGDDDEYDDINEWSLRSCAASSLDTLAGVYPHDEILPPLLPALQEALSHNDPWVREAGILALGAIAEGCSEPMKTHMSVLHPYLMNQITTSESLPQLTSISCWTLGRYADWAAEQTASGTQPDLIGRMTEAMLSRLMDRNRKVQIASCSALTVIVEQSTYLLVPYLEPLYKTITIALQLYRSRSLLVLLDTFGTLADSVGPSTGEGNLPSIYVPSLLHLWDVRAKQNPFDRLLLPLYESLSCIVVNSGMNFQPWALQTFEGAMSQINSIILYLTSCPDYDDEQADPIICLADLLDALVEGLGPNFAELLASSKQYGEHFLNMLRTLTSHDVDGVRMSAFAIMGDIAQKCPVVIQDCLGELLVEAISCIDPMYPGVCNNAVWAIGEVCAKCRGNPSPMQPYANDIVQKLIVLLMGSQYSDDSSYGMPIQGLAENASSAMGRLSLVDPSFVTQDLSRFLSGWCDGMAKISDLTEKRDAFEGFFAAIQSKPEIIGSSPNLLNDFTGILFAIVSWYLPTDNYSADVLHGSYDFQPLPVELDDFNHKIQIFVRGLKELVGEERWVELQKHMPVNVRRLLRENYGL